MARSRGMTVRRLVKELGPGEFQETLAFERMEPEPADVRAAGIRATVMNSQGGKKGGGAFMPADFLPQRTVQCVQTEPQIKAMMTAIFGPPTPPVVKEE